MATTLIDIPRNRRQDWTHCMRNALDAETQAESDYWLALARRAARSRRTPMSAAGQLRTRNALHLGIDA